MSVRSKVISAVAQEESRNISENIKWGYQRKFERGEIQTKYKNFMGYTEKNGELVIVPEEATIVKKIFELYAEGYSIRKICSYLEDNGIKPKQTKQGGRRMSSVRCFTMKSTKAAHLCRKRIVMTCLRENERRITAK